MGIWFIECQTTQKPLQALFVAWLKTSLPSPPAAKSSPLHDIRAFYNLKIWKVVNELTGLQCNSNVIGFFFNQRQFLHTLPDHLFNKENVRTSV